MKNKVILATGLLFLGTCAAAASYLYIADGAGDPTKVSIAENTKSIEPPTFLNVEPFVVNLADRDRERYLQVSLVFEVKSEETSKALAKIEPLIRSRTLLVLANKDSEQLKSPEGKQLLREELMDLAQVSLGDAGYGNLSAKVSDTHFSTFVIQ